MACHPSTYAEASVDKKDSSSEGLPSEARQGWEETFRKMAEQGDDGLLDRNEIESSTSWDEDEWSW